MKKSIPNCFTARKTNQTVTNHIITPNEFSNWLAKQTDAVQTWLSSMQFRAEAGNVRLIPDAQGDIASVICCVPENENLWGVGHLPFSLPEGFINLMLLIVHYSAYAIAWGLGAYQFTRYKKPLRQPAQLYLPNKLWHTCIISLSQFIWCVIGLIHQPMIWDRAEFAHVAKQLAKQYQAKFTQIIGEDLLKKNYASIYTVGRASDDAPRLVGFALG